MDFKLSFNMDNAAFEIPEEEINRILEQIIYQVHNGMTFAGIMDINGNTIGNWSIA